MYSDSLLAPPLVTNCRTTSVENNASDWTFKVLQFNSWMVYTVCQTKVLIKLITNTKIQIGSIEELLSAQLFTPVMNKFTIGQVNCLAFIYDAMADNALT